MYKCISCGAIFYETSTKLEEPDYVPSPFGIGTVRMGGGTFNCCPECESTEYEKMYFDGMHCPYCSEIINLNCIEDFNDCEFECKSCNSEFFVKEGDVEDAYQK